TTRTRCRPRDGVVRTRRRALVRSAAHRGELSHPRDGLRAGAQALTQAAPYRVDPRLPRAGPAGAVRARYARDRNAGCVGRARIGPRGPVRRTLALLRRGEARGDGLLRPLS